MTKHSRGDLVQALMQVVRPELHPAERIVHLAVGLNGNDTLSLVDAGTVNQT
jgi:hypothetical protein